MEEINSKIHKNILKFLYFTELKSLKEMGELLDVYDSSKLNLGEANNLNRHITMG